MFFFSLLFFKDLGHTVGSHFSSSSSMTIDVPINDMNHSLLGHNQLTTIDHSDLSAQLGLSLGGGASVSKSPEQPLSTTSSPAGSLQDEDMEDFRQVSLLVMGLIGGTFSFFFYLVTSPYLCFRKLCW